HTTQLTASAFDAIDNAVTGATYAWVSSNPAVASVDANGLVTGVSASATDPTITVTATSGGISKSASMDIHVGNEGGINWLEIRFTRSESMPPGFQTEMAITARESQGGAIINATFAYEALDPANLTASVIPGDVTALLTAVAPTGDGSKPRVK